MARRLTIADKLLLVAYELKLEGISEFTAEDLVVAAWKSFPDAFGLSGYVDDSGAPKYPDSNRVFAEIMGSKPLRRQGYLRKVGTKLYELSEVGLDKAQFLSGIEDEEAPTKAALPRSIELELRRLLRSRAAQKVREDESMEVTFHDACLFWGISPRSSAIELEGRLESTLKTIARAEEAIGKGAASFEHGGDGYTRKDLDLLRRVHRHLIDTFAGELSVIQERTDERSS